MVKAQFLFILTSLSIIAIQIRNTFYDYDDQQMAMIIMLLVAYAYILHLVQHKATFGKITYFSFSFLFPFGFLIVYFQLAVLDFFGFSVVSQFETFIWGVNNNISKTISLAGLGIVAFFLGTHTKPSTYIKDYKKFEYSKSLVQALTLLGWIFYILLLLNSGTYIFGAYAFTEDTWFASYAAKLFNVCLFSAISVELYRVYQSNNQVSFLSYLGSFSLPLLILTAIHTAFSIFVGDRGPVITYSILITSVYFIKFYQLSFFKVVIIVLLSSSFFTILGEARTRVLGEGFIDRFTLATETVAVSKFFDTTVPGSNFVELAASVRTLAVSVRDVPEEFGYQYGMFQIQQLVSVIPYFQSLLLNLVYDGNPIYDGSANFITYLIHRGPVGYGDGSSVIADLYLDFGVTGAVVVMFLFGLFISRIEIDFFSGNIRFGFRYLIFLTFLANAIYLSRSTLMLEFSQIVLSYFLINYYYNGK